MENGLSYRGLLGSLRGYFFTAEALRSRRDAEVLEEAKRGGAEVAEGAGRCF